LVLKGNTNNISYSGTQYTGLSSYGTHHLCLRTGTGTDDIVRYGLTTDTSSGGLRMRIGEKTAGIAEKYYTKIEQEYVTTSAANTTVNSSKQAYGGARTISFSTTGTYYDYWSYDYRYDDYYSRTTTYSHSKTTTIYCSSSKLLLSTDVNSKAYPSNINKTTMDTTPSSTYGSLSTKNNSITMPAFKESRSVSWRLTDTNSHLDNETEPHYEYSFKVTCNATLSLLSAYWYTGTASSYMQGNSTTKVNVNSTREIALISHNVNL
jgi:hypothetical protein